MANINALIGLTSFYNPHPAGSVSEQTHTEYYVDYLRDFSLQKYTSDAVGTFVQRASASQVSAMERLGSQFQSSIAAQTSGITSAIAGQTSGIIQAIGAQTAAIASALDNINDRLGALGECQRATNMLTGNMAQLLRIPDSERERRHTIEMGLKFLSNAQHDEDLFKDALDQFLKAEKLQSQDYFVLQKIGMIYLYVPALVNLRIAADFLTRSGKYAAVESHSSSVRSSTLLTQNPAQGLNQQPGPQSQDIARFAAESYVAASRAEYALGNLVSALQLAQKAAKVDSALTSAHLQVGKCAAASGQSALAAGSVRTAIGLRPSVGLLAAGDLDLLAVPEITDLLAQNATLIKRDTPFDPDAMDALRQHPIAATLQQAWLKIGKSGNSVPAKSQPLAQAIRHGSASENEIRLFVCTATSLEVVAWGAAVDEENDTRQTKVASVLNGVVAVATGGNHTVALRQDGTVMAWGANSNRQCTVPAGLKNATAIAAGYQHTVALRQDGTVAVWGKDVANVPFTVPVGLKNVMAIAAGVIHTVVLHRDGSVRAWEPGGYDGEECTVPAGLTNVTAIAAGEHTVALQQDGTVMAWGENSDGQCTVPPGLSGIVAIAAGWRHTVALRQDGAVVAWGENSDGQCTVPPGLSGIVAIAAGGVYTVALREFGGSVEATPDLALQFFKLGCALIVAADGKLSSKEQLWLEAHLGAGSPGEILSLITSHGPDGLQTELQALGANLSPEDMRWLHRQVWQLGDLGNSDGLEAEENDAIASILNACGWYALDEARRALLWKG